MLEDGGSARNDRAAYKTVVPSDPDFAKKIERADVLTFTSASTVRGFAELLGGDESAREAARGKCVACIGPITAQAAAEIGLHVDIVADRYTTAGLLDALDAHFAHGVVMQVSARRCSCGASSPSLAYRTRALSFGGAVAAFAVGAAIFGERRMAGGGRAFCFLHPLDAALAHWRVA